MSSTERQVGITVVGDVVTVVYAEVPDDVTQPIDLVADSSWKLQSGDRPKALDVIYQRCANYLSGNSITTVFVKASALPTGSVKLATLKSAEVRGVVVAASASVCGVREISKAVVSRTYGQRKVDEYLADDSFWQTHVVGGSLRKGSREAAMLLVAARGA